MAKQETDGEISAPASESLPILQAPESELPVGDGISTERLLSDIEEAMREHEAHGEAHDAALKV